MRRELPEVSLIRFLTILWQTQCKSLSAKQKRIFEHYQLVIFEFSIKKACIEINAGFLLVTQEVFGLNTNRTAIKQRYCHGEVLTVSQLLFFQNADGDLLAHA